MKKTTKKTTDRNVIVVDRGWIFAGDVREKNGRILLDRAVWVYQWNDVGFAAVVAAPRLANIHRVPEGVDIPTASEIFRIPVRDDWGL